MLNQVTLIGNVGRDAESRMTPSGKLVASFSLAINEGSGDRQTTLWVRVSAWEKLAEICQQYVAKGKQVLVVGRLTPANAYVDKAGNPAASYEVTAEKIRLLGSRDDGDGQPRAASSAPASVPPVDAADIPF